MTGISSPKHTASSTFPLRLTRHFVLLLLCRQTAAHAGLRGSRTSANLFLIVRESSGLKWSGAENILSARLILFFLGPFMEIPPLLEPDCAD